LSRCSVSADVKRREGRREKGDGDREIAGKAEMACGCSLADHLQIFAVC
jgi:hypothetical protein